LERVSLVESVEIDDAVRRSIDLIGGLQLDPGNCVVIKPNVCNPKNPDGMVITDFRIIKAVVDLVRKNGNELVVVESDNISGTADARVEKSGLISLVRHCVYRGPFWRLSTSSTYLRSRHALIHW
jgi:uncharacterized protein (DUF362 family)